MKKKAVGVLVNDIHLNKENGDLVKSIMSQAIDLADKYDTDEIFCGGDVFTNRSGQPLKTLKDFKEITENVKKRKKNFHVIPGNHDKTDSDDESSYLDVYSDIHLYSSSKVKFIGGIVIVFIPYFGDGKWLEEYEKADAIIQDCYLMQDIEDDTPIIMITHTGFDGVVNNDGSKVSSIIKPSMFKGFHKVLIGHYHNSSKLGSNVYYTGSAYQGNYGEDITDKGFTVIFNDGSTKFVPSQFPKYIKEYIDADDSETLRNLIEKYDGEDYDNIRFIFRGKKTDCQKINIVDLSRRGIDVKFEVNETIEAIEYSESDSVLTHDKKTITSDFFKYCKDSEIKGDKFKYGYDLIKSINVE